METVTAEPPKKFSLLDDVPLPPRRVRPIPPLPETRVERKQIWGTALSLEDGDPAGNFVVYAPKFEELHFGCAGHCWDVSSRVWGKLFTMVRALPLHVVAEHVEADEEYLKLRGDMSNQEALSQMGYMVSAVTDSISWRVVGDLPRIARVHLDGEVIEVDVDPVKGPISEGTPEFLGYRGEAGGLWRHGKRWSAMTNTEREVWLITIARHKWWYDWEKQERIKKQQAIEQKRRR